MEHDYEKIDEVTLALLYLVVHDKTPFGARAWKGFDWDTMNRLHEKGLTGDPVGKAKSVTMSLETVEYAVPRQEEFPGGVRGKRGERF